MNLSDTAKISRILNRLILVKKPASYTGGELNSVVKETASVRAAISYPDLYEIGMSNNGIQILYAAANSLKNIACERVFAPAPDFEALLRSEGAPLFTLESHKPLCELDLIGFNLSHELLYTNVLLILDLGRIPLLRTDRHESAPIVICGGSAASNPFPMADFTDAFFLGDGEEGFPEILEALDRGKEKGLSRHEMIEEIGKVRGVLLPNKYAFEFKEDKLISSEGPYAEKRIFWSATPSDPARPIVPNIRIIQNRAVAALTKGCFNLCKFCHAGYYDLPYRAFSPEAAVELVFEILANTGYNELTLSSLSLGDYGKLNGLLNLLLPKLTARGVSVSLPSLKVDGETLPLIRYVSDVRRTSLTFAVESGSQELRAFAHKRAEEEELLLILKTVLSSGWNLIKLYFMIGLPGCERVDEAEAVIGLLKKIAVLPNKRKEIHVTLSPFIPKPHTPFEREKQMDEEYFYQTVRKIKSAVPGFVKIKSHNIKASLLEGVFSRGDVRIGAVILDAYEKGCRFDSWSEYFRYDLWEESLNALMGNWRSLFDRRGPDELLPWKKIVTGREKLLAAMNRRTSCPKSVSLKSEPLDMEALSTALDEFKSRYSSVSTLRLCFSKTGNAAFVSHLDFVEIIKRALRMAELPAAFTQGFNKREKIAFSQPSSVGTESMCELCDVELYKSIPVDGLTERINSRLPEGIEVLRVESRPSDCRALSEISAALYRITVHEEALMKRICANLDIKPDFIKDGKGGEKVISFFSAVLSSSLLSENSISIMLKLGEGMRIDAVMLQLGNTDYNNIHLFSVMKESLFAVSEDGSLITV